MLLRNVLVSIFFAYTCQASRYRLADVAEQFRRHNISEDLHIDFKPQVLLEVTFPQANGSSVSITPGDELGKNVTLLPPSYRISGHAGPGPFVIICVDPDAPTPQNHSLSEIRHFMGGNFSLTDARDRHQLLNTTEPTTYYHSPNPIRSSDPHRHVAEPSVRFSQYLDDIPITSSFRYIFLLYKQSSGYAAAVETLVNLNTVLAFFNVSRFTSEAGLGQPVGGNFMLIRPDSSSPLTTTPPKPTPL